jgi:hypothetical protein
VATDVVTFNGWAANGLGDDRRGDARLRSQRHAVTTGWSVVKTFGELQALDRNGDGKLDASDPLWSKLKVWVQTGVDASGNPQGTLQSFADLGIQ